MTSAIPSPCPSPTPTPTLAPTRPPRRPISPPPVSATGPGRPLWSVADALDSMVERALSPSPSPSLSSQYSQPKPILRIPRTPTRDYPRSPSTSSLASEATESADGSTTATATPIPSPSMRTATLPSVVLPELPSATNPNRIFAASSALMSAVTAARGRNLIIGPCTCRTCSIGCLVALLAMATGRVDQLREDPVVPTYDQVREDGEGRGVSPSRVPVTARLGQASTQLRAVLATIAHIQFLDTECRILQAAGTQFVIALPYVPVDFLRTHKRIVGSTSPSPSSSPSPRSPGNSPGPGPGPGSGPAREGHKGGDGREGNGKGGPGRRNPDGRANGAGAPGTAQENGTAMERAPDSARSGRFHSSRSSHGSGRSFYTAHTHQDSLDGVPDAAGIAERDLSYPRTAPLKLRRSASRPSLDGSDRERERERERERDRMWPGSPCSSAGPDVPEDATGDILATWGNFAWGARRNSVSSSSLRSYRSLRRARSNSSQASGSDEDRSGALQVILEATNVESEEAGADPAEATEMLKEPSSSGSGEDMSADSHNTSNPSSASLLCPRVTTPSPPETPLKTPDPSPDLPNPAEARDPWAGLARSPSQQRKRASITSLIRLIVPENASGLTSSSGSPGNGTSASVSASTSSTACVPNVARATSPAPLSPRLSSPAELAYLTAGDSDRFPCFCTPSNIQSVRDAKRTADETIELRRNLTAAHAEAELLKANRTHLEETIAVLRGRLAAAESMLDTYEDLTREVEEERRVLESEKFLLEMENMRLSKKNASLVASGRR